jgi:enoyl-CoA hydratase
MEMLNENVTRSYQNIHVYKKSKVALISLHRPASKNAINLAMAGEIADAVHMFEKDEEIGCLVITGSETVFSVGADVKELANYTIEDLAAQNFFGVWRQIGNGKKPMISAVSGLALGGGCELALMSDIVIASHTVEFGQPEIFLGLVPAMGGTQRLARTIGRSNAMDMCLTGRRLNAHDAQRLGLVSRVLPPEEYLDEAIAIAEKVASFSMSAVSAVKWLVNEADETSLSAGIRAEQAKFASLMNDKDAHSRLSAFSMMRSS